jgi:threonylcarbamoyladenosine tRNA methylthiotransferase MtaB
MKVALSAVGCKLNQYEVQAMAEALEPYGFQRVPFSAIADLYIINTCTVTGRADFSSRQLIRQALRKSPTAKVIVTGCYAELEREFLRKLGDISFIADNKQKQKIPELVLDLFGIDKAGGLLPESIISRMSGHSRAFVKIQDGCVEKCTYCTIWKARGTPYSRGANEIVKEINALYTNGYREVVLTGVHIGKYHKEGNLAELLNEILGQTSMPRIRLSSLKPNEIGDDLVDLIASQTRICAHFHIPIQSGDNAILKSMGRKYTFESVNNAIMRLIDVRAESTIGADFIVGFPGEKPINFKNTNSMANELPIHHFHVFSYSDRPGTVASGFADKVNPKEKGSRRQILQETGERKKQAHLQKFIGRTLDVIVEERNKAGMSTGMSGNYLKVKFAGNDYPKKSLIQIRIASVENSVLIGDAASIEVSKN